VRSASAERTFASVFDGHRSLLRWAPPQATSAPRLSGKAGARLSHRPGWIVKWFTSANARSEVDSHGQRQRIDRLGQYVERSLSALEEQAAAALRRARRLPIGAERNDLRQLAMGLLWLHRNGMEALVKQRSASRLTAEREIAPVNRGS
jgi:hypothetical protein